MDLKIWAPLSHISQSILDKVRLAYVFGSQGHDAFMITEDDEVLACGSNKQCCLGIGCDSSSLKPKNLGVLKKKGVKGFSFCYGSADTFVVAYTFTGEVYAWGKEIGVSSIYYYAGEQQTRIIGTIYQPKLVSFPSKSIKISEVACGTTHCLALSIDGVLYCWGLNDVGQLGNSSQRNFQMPQIIENCLKNKRVVKISCGDNFSVVLLDNGQVYAWGDNKYGQVGLVNSKCSPSPVKIRGLNEVIKDIVCGSAHCLVVTNVGAVYGWGKNTRGELGLGDKESRILPEMIPTDEKFVDIAAASPCSISAAMNEKFEVFMWGDFLDFCSSTPEKTAYKSLQEVFAHFGSPRVMYKPIVRQIEKNSESTFVIPEKRFQDEVTSDLTIIADGKQIFVHREILSSRSDYFRVFLQEHWVQDGRRVINIDQRFEVIHSYLQYIYTGETKADPDLAPEILCLANEYQDATFKNLCEECLDFNIGIDNVASLFALALKLQATKLLEKCITFAGCRISEVLLTPDVSKWDKETYQEFVMQCQKRKLFRS